MPVRISRVFFPTVLTFALVLVFCTSKVSAQQFLSPASSSNSFTSIEPSPTPTAVSEAKSVLELNLLRPLMQLAAERGTSENLLALLLLLPVVATLVAFARHIIGLTGFSIYAPAGLAIILLSTGTLPGIVLFLLMLAVASLGKWVISFLKLEYVPRTAMLLLSVSLGLFLTILLSTLIPEMTPLRIEIFPLLLLVLLAEDFLAPLSGLKWNLIIERSLQIMILAIMGELFMGNFSVQQFALLNPEIVITLIAVANFLIGKYLGLRLTEYFRFRPLMDAEE